MRKETTRYEFSNHLNDMLGLNIKVENKLWVFGGGNNMKMHRKGKAQRILLEAQ